MSAPFLLNTCQVCGAEESLDALLMRMIDDDTVRRLVADVINMSFPLGGLVVRYLRLHKPPKQRLRMSMVSKLLAELVPDMQRTAIQRNGRMWAVSAESWKAALQVVFDAADKGSLTLPLDGNGYLYGVLMRMADRQEAVAERDREAAVRNRPTQSGAQSVDALIAATLAPDAVATAAGRPVATAPRVAPPPGPKVESPTVRRMKAGLVKTTADATGTQQ